MNGGVVFRSRATHTVRHDTDAGTVWKTGADHGKLAQEVAWYQAVEGAALLTPKILEQTGDGYQMSYVSCPTVAALERGGHLAVGPLLAALDRCLAALEERSPVSLGAARRAAQKMYVDKLTVRLAATRCGRWVRRIDSVNGRPVPTLSDLSVFAYRAASLISTAPARFGRVHGDLCFGNMLFDGHNHLWLIDPRGSFGHLIGCYGDRAYDLAKLSHSMLGGYDYIAADRYYLTVTGTSAVLKIGRSEPDLRYWLWLQSQAQAMGLTMFDVRFLEAICFLSLAALHTESADRQAAFIVRGLEVAGEAMAWEPSSSQPPGEAKGSVVPSRSGRLKSAGDPC